MTATEKTAITYKSVTKTYGGTNAVNNIDMILKKGELTALLGENGAGKTTSISLALGLIEPSVGEVTIAGNKAGSLEARRNIGAMLQTGELPNQLTAAEHIRLFSGYYINPVPLDELVEMLDLSSFLNQRYSVLSGGQKRRVQMALALCGNADFIILDEPTVGLDIETRHSVWKAIRACLKRGQGVVLTTHYLEEADALADRVLVMVDGNIVADGTPAEIKALSAEKVMELQTDAPIKLLEAQEGVQSVKIAGQQVRITASHVEPCLEFLFKNGYEVSDLMVSSVGLEAAFLDITHRSKQNNKLEEAA